MAPSDTLIIRAAFGPKATIYRDIEIEGSKSLYRLAEAIVAAFGFKPATIMHTASEVRIEIVIR